MVGERGVSLSGGQRARVNLARAVYFDTDIYLLDDPLSAVDTHVSKHLFQECIQKYLGKKTRILATHQLQFIKDADVVIIMNNVRENIENIDRYYIRHLQGKIESFGPYADIPKNILKNIKTVSEEEKENPEEKLDFRERLQSVTSFKVSNQ